MGCDHALHGMASRDTCGVWCGNGSTCVSVSDTYTIPEVSVSGISELTPSTPSVNFNPFPSQQATMSTTGR